MCFYELKGGDLKMNNRSQIWDILLYASFLIAGLLSSYHPMILSGLSFMQTDPGDTRLNNYILEHGYQWILNNPLHKYFWNPPIFFPAPNTAAYSDIILSSAPIYWLCRLSGLYWDTSFQLWMMAVLSLNYLMAIILFRQGLGLSVLSAVAGAYIFSFAGIRISQLGHQQLLPQFFSILAIFSLIKIFKYTDQNDCYPSSKNLLWMPVFALSVVLQLYSGFYLGWFLCFGLLVFFAIAVLFREPRQLIIKVIKENFSIILVSAILSAAALSWMGYHYLLSLQEVGKRPWWEAATMIPRLKSWINLGPHNWVYSWTRTLVDFNSLPMEHEHRIGLGLADWGDCVGWTYKNL